MQNMSASCIEKSLLGDVRTSLSSLRLLPSLRSFSCRARVPVGPLNGGTAPLADEPIGRAFASGTSDVQVQDDGKVISVLPDELDGSRHQRFIVQLASGQTLLITHNIDVAPRIAGLKVGDSVGFNGEYVWNEKGGVIHWTHHDPQGRHVAGWVMHNGKRYQ